MIARHIKLQNRHSHTCRSLAIRAPRHTHTHCSHQTQLEKAERNASTSAIIGLSSAFLGDYVSSCISQTSLGIVNQLALQLHTTPFIAYFVIVFIIAHDIEKTTRILILPNELEDMENKKKKEQSFSRMSRLHLIIGRASMLLFIYFLFNGLYHHGIHHEIGPLEQMGLLA